MKMRIHYVLPLCLVFACDKTERDWSKCTDQDLCKDGYHCTPAYVCVANDAGAPDVPPAPVDANSREAAGADSLAVTVDAPVDATVDVPAAVDVAADAGGDVAVADAVADLSTDSVDSQEICGSDIECPATAPLCLDFQCTKCKSNSMCAARADGGSAGICDTSSGRCVVCAKNSDCNADPTKPVCVANQCVACTSAPTECRTKNASTPVCNATTGKCVGCLSNDNCAGSVGSGDGGVDGGGDGGADAGVVAGFCYLTTNQCVECLAHADCKNPSKPICGGQKTCVACGTLGESSNACASKNAAQPVCKPDTGACVQCAASTDCRGDAGLGVCNPTTNKCVECNDSSNCTSDPARAFCQANACVGCQTAGADACTGAKPVCASSGTSAGQCVECTANSDCKVATKPVCDANQCRACKKDLECTGVSPALVCGLDGSCPGNDAVIYLRNGEKCPSDPGIGTSARPYCSSADATAALSTTRTVIVVQGPLAVGNLTLNYSQKPVLIAGQNSAKITTLATGTPPLVAITAGDVTLRDLTIGNGNDAGVSVSGGATLHMDRCYVLNNQGIGIQTSASAFEIINTVVAGNGAAAGGYGVSLGNYSGSPTTFVFNTVVSNVGGGVFCGTPSNYPLTGILANANGPANFLNCQPDSATSTSTTPGLDANYHLTTSSPCVNHAGTTCLLIDDHDIDGDIRPKGGACDCGADEY